MMIFIMVIHAVVCILLACIILMQSGRGGGLTENFASAEAIFGAQTNSLLVRTTTILAVIFIFTSLGLTIMHSMKGKSLMSDRVAMPAVPSPTQTNQAVQNLESDIQKVSQEAAKQINVIEQNSTVAAPVIQDAPVPSTESAPVQ